MHGFVQQLEPRHVLDRAWRAEQEHASTGRVLEAPYFNSEQTRPAAWWEAVVRFVTRAKPQTRRFNLPFDEHGSDVLGLCEAEVGGVSIVRGNIVPLRSGSDVVLRDLWLDNVRLAEMDDFAVAGDDGMVIVACGMAPLLIAVPTPCGLDEWLASSGKHVREMAPRLADRRGAALRLQAGDSIEVRGIARPLSTTARTIDLSGWRGDYRTAPPVPDRLIGDEEGTRLVIRVLGRPTST